MKQPLPTTQDGLAYGHMANLWQHWELNPDDIAEEKKYKDRIF